MHESFYPTRLPVCNAHVQNESKPSCLVTKPGCEFLSYNTCVVKGKQAHVELVKHQEDTTGNLFRVGSNLWYKLTRSGKEESIMIKLQSLQDPVAFGWVNAKR
jgi:hypothetical protein